MEVLEGLNVLVCINGRKNKLRVYYLSWLRNKIVKGDDVSTQHVFCHYGDVTMYMCDSPGNRWRVRGLDMASSLWGSWTSVSTSKLVSPQSSVSRIGIMFSV